MRCSLAVLTLAGALLIGLVGTAADAQETTGEGTSELGFWKRLSATDMLYVPMSVTRADANDHAEALAGMSYERRLDAIYSVRGGFRYVWELTPPLGESRYREYRVLTELFIRPWPRARLDVVDRARVELRWVDGDLSWRFRDRVRLGRAIPRRRIVSLMPYGMFEATYDNRYRTINRLRLSLGAVFRLTPWLGVDPYVARQRDSRSDAARLDAGGVTLNFYF